MDQFGLVQGVYRCCRRALAQAAATGRQRTGRAEVHRGGGSGMGAWDAPWSQPAPRGHHALLTTSPCATPTCRRPREGGPTMAAIEDPRWGANGGARSPAASSSFSYGQQAERTGSFSIVFSAHWVRTTAPIGEGAFSRVYEGIYTNPETSEESVVAVKILKRNMLKRRSDCLRFIKEAKIMTKISHRRARG